METKELNWVTKEQLKYAVDETITKGGTDIQIIRTSDFEAERQDFPLGKIYTACYLLIYKKS